jgi:NADPH-dependent 2,4-dienoyl-CoA reductase/sulfur reductase-like enzyme
MRASIPGIRPVGELMHVRFAGHELACWSGDTVAAALIDAGEYGCREAADGSLRGVFCGMGVCHECLVTIDGRPGFRACMTPVRDGMEIGIQPARPALGELPPGAAPREAELTCDVLVIGAGAAGLTAASALAEAGLDVVLVDERPKLGGQFYKQPSHLDDDALDAQYRAGRRLIERAERSGCRVLSSTQVWAIFGPGEVAALGPETSWILRPRRLVIASGAYERGVPLPGWTLPGVMTTGAAQTLLRSYHVVPGRRVLVAGNGPLNMQVAAELVRAGATVVALAELAPGLVPSRLDAAARMLALAPDLIRDGLGYQATLRRAGVPALYRTALVRADGDRQVARAQVARIDDDGRPVAGSERWFEIDAICMGYGFLSSSELSRAAGCRHVFDARQGQLVVAEDGRGHTSLDDVWAIGDGAGVGGARLARALGTIAAFDVVRSLGGVPGEALAAQERRARRARWRGRRFQAALWRFYAAPRLDDQLAIDDTDLCRCESVSRGAIQRTLEGGIGHVGAIKRVTRAGMGGCQGRYCGPILAELSSRASGRPIDEFSLFAPTAPFKPMRIASLARSDPARTPTDPASTVPAPDRPVRGR